MSNEPALPSELRDLLDNIRATIADVSSNQLHQLSSDRSINQDSFDSITSQIKIELNQLDNKLDELEILADECEEDSIRSHALKIVQEHRNDASRLRSSLRTISLEVKRTMSNAAIQSSRAELLSGAKPKNRSSDPEEALMSASSDVTQSLRNTLELMKQELDRSVMSTHMLEQQTATLKLTSDEYFTFGELMKTSRALITSLQRADLFDRIILSAALLFFVLVCIYILKKRIFDRGISLISTIISPFRRYYGDDPTTITHVSSNFQDNVYTAAAAVATATSATLIPSLVAPDIPPINPSIQEPSKPPLHSTLPILSASSPYKPIDPLELGLLHEEL